MKKIFIMLLGFAFMIQMMSFAYADVEFRDVNQSDWFYDNLIQMLDMKMVNGYEDGTFKPQNSLKVDEFIKFILSGLGYEFNQSQDSYWAEDIIKKAEELKICDKSFISDYTAELTREQASKIIVNALSLKEQKPTNYYASYIKLLINDFNKVSEMYKEDVVNCYAWGIMQGDNHKRVNPKNKLTRAEATAIILRMIKSEQRLDMNFEGRHIEVADGTVPDFEAKVMMLTPRYQNKAVYEVTDVAYILQSEINNDKLIQIMYYDSNKCIKTEGYGDISNATDIAKTIGDKKNNSSLEQLSDLVTDYLDYKIIINTKNFDTKVPITISVTKQADYKNLGYKNYGEYFLDKYGESFKNVFIYLFEDEFVEAWKNFELALTCDGEACQVDTEINNRQLKITFDNNSIVFSISLKNNLL